MKKWNTPGSLGNHGLRLFCTWLLLYGQAFLASGGCAPTSGGSVQGNDNTTTNDDTDDDPMPPSGTSASVDGYWMSTRTTSVATVRGLATGGQFGEAVNIDLSEDDGGSWGFSGSFDNGTLDVTCVRPFDGSDFGGLFEDPDVCTGVFSGDGMTLTVSGNIDGIAHEWVLTRSTGVAPDLTASWSDADESTQRLISAFDGHVLALLDPDDSQQEFDAVWDAFSNGFVGTNADGYMWVGLPFDDGQMFVWIDDFGTFVAQHSYLRQNEPSTFASPLTGRWMSSFNDGELTDTLRGQASVIFDGTNLYVYQRDDNHRILFSGDWDEGGYWSVFATFDGVRFNSTNDSATTWSGMTDDSGTIISGYWNNDESMSLGFAKSSLVNAEDLSGLWSSVSSDYETPSDPTQTTGQAEVNFDGATLTVHDRMGGADFTIEAEWTGDHFEGEWWSVESPDERLQWRGEILLGGALVHGKWERGEWSFTPFSVQTRSSIADVNSGEIAIIANPFEDMAAAFHDEALGVAVTAYRRNGAINRFSIVGSQGSVEMSVDSRGRPLSVVGPDLNVTLVWSEDSSSVELTFDPDGTATSETVQIDLSDEALLAMLDDMQSLTGVNADVHRTWIAGNPGRLAAVARGDESLLSLSDPYAKVASGKWAAHAKNATAAEVAKRAVTDAAAIAGVVWGAVAASSAIAGAATTTLAIAFGGLTLLAAAAAGFLIVFFLWEFLFACFPCSLSCFWNCR